MCGCCRIAMSRPTGNIVTRSTVAVPGLGIACERTSYVYSPLTNIVERVGTQGAPYGSTNALRTITAFYPTEVGAAGSAARAGKVKSIRRENGRFWLDLDPLWRIGATAARLTSLAESRGSRLRGLAQRCRLR